MPFEFSKGLHQFERTVCLSLALVAANILFTEGLDSLVKSTLTVYRKFPFVNLVTKLLATTDNSRPERRTEVQIALENEDDDFNVRPLKRYVSSSKLKKSPSLNDLSCERFMRNKVPLRMKDEFLLEMLHSGAGSIDGNNSFTISDPNKIGTPIVYCTDKFCELTGYEPAEILGKNLSALEGPETSSDSIFEIRNAMASKKDISICVVNYLKSGQTFFNQFFMTPLYDTDDNLAYFIGVHVQVSCLAVGQDRENPAVVVNEDYGYLEDADNRGMLG